MNDQLPALIIVLPLVSALLVNIAGRVGRSYCWLFTVLVMTAVTGCALGLVSRVMTQGIIHYRLGGWPAPVGIEYVVDHLNVLMLVLISAVSLVAAIYSGPAVQREIPEQTTSFYTLFILLVAGLLGMTITGDAFNLYVLVEISALTGYGLIALGQGRAFLASFNYIIMGTVGACFYLLGVGHLYIKTGSLNMKDLYQLLPSLYSSETIAVAFILILAGVWAKMAFFPLHTWLPNAYTYAPTATSALVAPLMTKVSVYVMIRIIFSVFSPEFAFHISAVRHLVVWMAVVGIVTGSVMALLQTDFKKMLTYLIIAEVGYMVGGVWLANRAGITGAVLHVINDALMTLSLFLVAGVVTYRTGGHQVRNLQGFYRIMPWTMAAFTLAALSMIGVPPTVGFFSKWYLMLGAIHGAQWHFVAALVFSSLMNALLFFRIMEMAFFDAPDPAQAWVGPEAPVSMMAPVLGTAVGLLAVGLNSRVIVDRFIQFVIPAGL